MRVADATIEGLLLQEHNSFWMHGGVASVKDLVAGDRTGATLMVPTRSPTPRQGACDLEAPRVRHTARNAIFLVIGGAEQVRLAYICQAKSTTANTYM